MIYDTLYTDIKNVALENMLKSDDAFNKSFENAAFRAYVDSSLFYLDLEAYQEYLDFQASLNKHNNPQFEEGENLQCELVEAYNEGFKVIKASDYDAKYDRRVKRIKRLKKTFWKKQKAKRSAEILDAKWAKAQHDDNMTYEEMRQIDMRATQAQKKSDRFFKKAS